MVSLKRKCSHRTNVDYPIIHETKPARLRRNLLQDDNEDFSYETCQNLKTERPEQSKDRTKDEHPRRFKTFLAQGFEFDDVKTKEEKPEPDIYFKDESDQETKDQTIAQTVQPNKSPPNIPIPKVYKTFYQLASDCKLLSDSRDLLNKIPTFDQTEFRISRKRIGLTANYILYTVCF